MSDIKLKPCPFCGGECEIERMGTSRVSMQYQCSECGCSLETGEIWLNDNCRWNERNSDTMQARIDKLESLIKEADDYLNTNKLTTICNGSILHMAFKEALKDEKGS